MADIVQLLNSIAKSSKQFGKGTEASLWVEAQGVQHLFENRKCDHNCEVQGNLRKLELKRKLYPYFLTPFCVFQVGNHCRLQKIVKDRLTNFKKRANGDVTVTNKANLTLCSTYIRFLNAVQDKENIEWSMLTPHEFENAIANYLQSNGRLSNLKSAQTFYN
jgi:hypothetical protein